MKWINHQAVTGVIVYAATNDLLLTAYGMAGAILPDKLEGNPRSGDYWSWRSRHRGWSHWPMLYAAFLGLLLRSEQEHWAFWNSWDLSLIGIYLCIGALLHIAEDAVCGKVPFLFPSQKIGWKLFAVGSVMEYVFCIGVVLACYLIKTSFPAAGT